MSSADYCAYYDNQMGGAQLRVFRGGIQSGAGLGDILRGVVRFLVPIALKGLGYFAGKRLGDAAKAALGQSSAVVGQPAAPVTSRFMNAYMPGFGPHQPQPELTLAEKQALEEKQHGSGGTIFDGVEGIPTSASAIKHYKKAACPAPKARKAKSKSKASARFNF